MINELISKKTRKEWIKGAFPAKNKSQIQNPIDVLVTYLNSQLKYGSEI